MKPAIEALLVALDHKMRVDILTGIKSISIREGCRNYHIGSPLVLCCHIVPWAVMSTVTQVRHCLLSEVTEKEYTDDGFGSQKDLLIGMKEYYPEMTLDSPITIIRWGKVSGFLVDHSRSY